MLAEQNNIDVVALQEPAPQQFGTIGGVPMRYRTVVGTQTEHPQSALIILNKNLNIIKIAQDSNTYFTTISLDINNINLTLCSAYFKFSIPIATFTDKLTTIARNNRNRPLIIMADTNARSPQWFDHILNQNGQEMMRCLDRNELLTENQPGQPFTYSHNGNSNIDLTITNSSATSLVQGWEVHEDWISNDQHRPITFTMDTGTATNAHSFLKKRFLLQLARWDDFEGTFEGLLLDERVKKDTVNELESSVQKLSSIIKQAAVSSIPVTQSYKLKKSQWWNADLMAQRTTLRRLRKLAQRDYCPQQKLLHTNRYKTQLNIYKKNIKQAKMESFQDFVTENGNNNPWGIIYKMHSNKIRSETVVSTIHLGDGNHTSAWSDTAALLLDTLFGGDNPNSDTPLHREIRTAASLPYNSNDPTSYDLSILDCLVTSLKRKKSPGPDMIHSEMIQRIWTHLRNPITEVFKACIDLGHFPKPWKKSETILILKDKARDTANPRSYRPIMLLPALGKLLERVLVDWMERWISSIPGMYTKQYGFRKNKSTEDAIMEVTSHVKGSRHKYVLGIFFDITGAFDNLWWPSIMHRLRDLNCPTGLFNILRSYFADRCTEHRGRHQAISRNITIGCPQGSVLGPHIWNLVFDDSMTDCNIEVAYADDKVILIEANTRTELENKGQIAVDTFQRWCERVKLNISREKTTLVLLKGKLQRAPIIKLNNRSISMKKYIKYLGVILQENLSMDMHVKHLRDKNLKLFGALRRLSQKEWGLRKRALSLIYKGVAESTLTYAAAGWYHLCNQIQRNSLRATQRDILLKTTTAYNTVSNDAVCVIAGAIPILLLIEERIELSSVRKQDRSNYTERKKCIRQQTIAKWQESWRSSINGRVTFALIPEVQQRIRSKSIMSHAAIQFATGHGKFEEYFQRVGLNNAPLCELCDELDNSMHQLAHCPLFHSLRQDALITVGPDLTNWKIYEGDHLELFERLCNNINTSKASTRYLRVVRDGNEA